MRGPVPPRQLPVAPELGIQTRYRLQGAQQRVLLLLALVVARATAGRAVQDWAGEGLLAVAEIPASEAVAVQPGLLRLAPRPARQHHHLQLLLPAESGHLPPRQPGSRPANTPG